MLAGGCRAHGDVLPAYDSVRPARIDACWPVNETVYPLEKVVYGGLLQRALPGDRVYNVYRLLYRGLRDALEAKGYGITENLSQDRFSKFDFRAALPDGSPEVPFDAVLYTTIRDWVPRKRAHPHGVRLTLHLELFGVPGGEKLYEYDHSIFLEDGFGDNQGRFLVHRLRFAAYRALGDLPARTEG